MVDERLVRQAIELARLARRAGNHPFGALLYWAGVRSVVYALPSEQLAALAARDFVVPCRELFSRSQEAVQVVGPVLVEEARAVHLGFWQSTPVPEE